jgi:biopolymer transport protein ExbD
MLTSTLIAPNAIKLLLPTSNSRTIAKQTVTVYINDKLQYYVNESPVSSNSLENRIEQNLKGQTEGSVVLRSDYTVAIQYVVNVINAVNNINEKNKTKHKVILATRPKP